VEIDTERERIRHLEHSQLLMIPTHCGPRVCTALATFSCIAGEREGARAVISSGAWSPEPGA
jgi:hypothetical protein